MNTRVPRVIAQMPGEGPTWLGFLPFARSVRQEAIGCVLRQDQAATRVYETGLCVWNESKKCSSENARRLESKRRIAKATTVSERSCRIVARCIGTRMLLFGDPFPALRFQPILSRGLIQGLGKCFSYKSR